MKTKKTHHLLLGAHMSATGGLYKAIERGASIGCTTIQLFTKSNRQWAAKKITPQDVESFKQTHKESHIEPIVAHASYLINIGSPDKATAQRSTKALADELERCNQLGIPYLVFHPGSHLQTGEPSCLERISTNILSILSTYTGKTTLLLETMAGQGSSVCYSFEHLATVLRLIKYHKKVGICLDTCHVFAAGYDFTTPKTYQDMWHQFNTIIGMEHLHVIHINDSKKECGSRVDRHEDIGKGKIGLQGFKLLFNDPNLFHLPKILETPKESPQDDARNMKVIYGLLSEKTKKELGIK